MKSIISKVLNKKASELNPDYKINCFTTVVSYFENNLINSCMTAEEMLKWLQENTIQIEQVEPGAVVVIWSSSDVTLSPPKVSVAHLLKSAAGYPFGLVMEHAAVFVSESEVLQKASPKDQDPFEIMDYQKMLDNDYGHLSWVRTTFHSYGK